MRKIMRTLGRGESKATDKAGAPGYATRHAASTCSLPSKIRVSANSAESREDAADLALARQRMADKSEPNISWDDLKTEMEAEKKAA